MNAHLYHGNYNKYDVETVDGLSFEEKLGQVCLTKLGVKTPLGYIYDGSPIITITKSDGVELAQPFDINIDDAFAQQCIPAPEWDKIDVKHSSDTSVHKYIYTKSDAIAESVLYAYPTFDERTVMCISTMTGCPMGCTFCGTGKFFGRSLTADEMIEQIEYMARSNNINMNEVKKLQLMFMSMGEPILNANMSVVYDYLRSEYPDAQLLVSTSGPKSTTGWEMFMNDATFNPNIGLQFSVHESTDQARDKLIPMKGKLTLEQISQKGLEFFLATKGRKPFFNYCVHEGNSTKEDAMRLRMLFDPKIWECTLSVICEADDTIKDANEAQLPLINDFSSELVQLGFNTRIFNPAGTDDIGGGCGQLWQVQKFAHENPNIMKQSPGNKIHCRVTE